MLVEMKFVLLFALLAYTKFSLGNSTGAVQVSQGFDINQNDILCSLKTSWDN